MERGGVCKSVDLSKSFLPSCSQDFIMSSDISIWILRFWFQVFNLISACMIGFYIEKVLTTCFPGRSFSAASVLISAHRAVTRKAPDLMITRITAGQDTKTHRAIQFPGSRCSRLNLTFFHGFLVSVSETVILISVACCSPG